MEYLKRSVVRKIIFVSIVSIIISMSALTYIIVCNTFDAMKESNEQTIKKEISLLVENIQTFNNVAKTGADRMGDIFMDMIGKVEVVNNEEINIKGLSTPVILVDNQIANLNFSVVDKFTKITEGSVATIFVRKGQDFIRVTTSLKKENGQRAIGTKLNRNHPSYKKAIKGEEYLGKAVLFGKSYMTKYIPIKDKSNNVIAIAFIGSDITTDLKQLTNTIGSKKIGKTGYYYILNSKEGKNYGKFLFHPKLNNSFGLDFKDSKGNYFIKNMLKAKNGVLEYLWKGDKKFVVYETFDEWNWLLVGGVYSHEILEKANQIMYITIALSILTLILISLSIFATLRISLRSLNKIKDGLLEFFNYLNRKTDNIEKISVNTIDEFGVMANVINENIEKTQKNLEDDRKLIDETISVLGEFEQGDLCQRLNSSVENPALLELKTVLNKMADNLEKNIDNVLNILEEYSNYKYLNKISKKDLKEHLLKLANGVNHLGDSITLMLVENKSNGLTLDESSNILLENVDKLNNSSTEAASSLEETAATLEQITSNIRSNTENIEKMSNFSNEVIKSATCGESLANETTNAMDEINEQVVSINEAITVIDQIAFQTNILSLNAAVEAATAGDAGKGFAVVAQEVRNLASRSAEAAKEIKNLVETATLKANSGKEIATDMINGYKQLNENITYSMGLIQDIENASKEQLQGIEQINDAVNQLDQQTQQNAMVASQTHDVAVLTDEIAKLVVSKADEKEFEGKNEAKALKIKKSNKFKDNQASKVNLKNSNDNKWEKF